MSRVDVDRNLLFGLLALQTGLIDRPALAKALRAWAADKSRDLAEVLADQGDLPDSRRSVLEALVVGHVNAHDADPTRSLAAVEAGESTLELIREVGDPGLEATVDVIGSATTEFARGERTRDFDIGSSGDGLRRFRVLRPHRRGGLGAVFVALDAELNREVALKQILEKHADDPVSRARFLLEAEITGGLEHPGIVPVYGLGAFSDGRPYYAMRFIRGDSLKDAIARFHQGSNAIAEAGSGELELRKLLRRFLDVCNAIEYAHRRGVLHRDLKPGNVMVGKYGETLVVDWGLAKAVGKPDPGSPEGEQALSPSHSSGTVETIPGKALGTPSYMSPEQAAGEIDALGPRSDVYSLGATLYCLLTGRPPFEGPDAGAIIQAVIKGDPTPPRKHRPTVDRALEAVCLKAMARAPEARYASPAALAEEVDRWMADDPVLAFPEPRSRKLARWGRRHSSIVTGGGVFLVAAVVGLALVAWLVARHNARLDAARLEAKAAGGMAHKAVRRMLSDVAGYDLLNIPQGERLRVRLAERALELYRDFVKVHPADPDFGLEHARIEEQIASLYRMIGRYPESREQYTSAIRRLGDLAPLDPDSDIVPELLAYTEGQFAEMIRLAGGPDGEAEPHYRESIRIFESLIARHPADPKYAKRLAVALSDFAEILNEAGRFADSEPLLRRAVVAAERFQASLPRPPDPARINLEWLVLPMIQGNRGSVLLELGRGVDAEAALGSAIGSLRALLATYPQANDVKFLLAGDLQRLGDAKALDQGRRPAALQDLDEAVGLLTPLLTEFPDMVVYPRFLVTLRADRGSIRLAAGQLAEAREDLAFADGKLSERLRVEKEPAGPLREHARVKSSMASLADRQGDRVLARGLADEAIGLLRRAMALEPGRPADRTQLDRASGLREELARPRP